MSPDLAVAIYGAGAIAMFMHLYRLTSAGWPSLLFAVIWPLTGLGLLVVEFISPDTEEDSW